MIHTATIKIKVVLGEPSPPPPPPPPPFVGTRIKIAVDDEQRMFRIGNLDAGSMGTKFAIDWGDGVAEYYTGSILLVYHEYAKAGTYEIRISDDVETMNLGNSDEAFNALYPPMVLSFVHNGEKLLTLNGSAFANCKNLTAFDVREGKINKLSTNTFIGCEKLGGVLFFPCVTSTPGRSQTKVFSNCTGGITEIHFAESAEEVITATASYKADLTLGTGTAVCVFDL